MTASVQKTRKKSTDRRARYTRHVLKQSLIELMKAKPLQKITVRELCEVADINRATFYAHYQDTYELLNEIESELLNSVKNSLEKQKRGHNLNDILVEICRAILHHRDLCSVLFSPFGNKEYLEKILNVAYEQSIRDWSAMFPDVPVGLLEQAYTFFSHGSASVIALWIADGMKEKPEEIAGLIEGISNGGLRWLKTKNQIYL